MFFTRLIEVGRKISKANRAKIHAAMETLRELISQAVETDTEATEADRSYSDKEKLLRSAIRAKLKRPTDQYEPYCYVQDMFDTWFVFTTDEGMFKVDYVIGSEGAVTLGEPKAVIPRTVYEDAPVSEAAYELDIVGDTILLQEAGDAPTEINLVEAAGGKIKIISPGWGSSGYYSPAMLKRDGPAAFPAGTHMYWDHPTAAEEAARPENSLTKLSAVTKAAAAWDDAGPKGPGLYAPMDVFEQYKSPVKEMAPYIGVSIRAAGTARNGEAEGRKGPIIEKISQGKSVDFVTRAGAGGQIVSLFEAAGRRPEAPPTPTEETTEMNEAQINALIEAAVKPLREENAASKTEATRLRETLALRDARDYATRKLATIDLPAATKQRLAESLPAKATLTEGALDSAAFDAVIEAAVLEESNYLKSIGVGTGRITGMGTTQREAAEPMKTEAVAAKFKALGLSEAAAKYAAEGRAA